MQTLSRMRLEKRGLLILAINDFDDRFIMSHFKIEKELLETLKALITPEIKAYFCKVFSSASIKKYYDSSQKKLKSPKKGRRYGNRSGYREDLQESFKSKAEANVARYLTSRHGKSTWEYECEQFILPLKTLTGRVKTYTPDFRLKLRDGTVVWLEVKPGFLPQTADRLKLRTFCSSYPDKKLIIVTQAKSDKVIKWATKQGIEIWYYEELMEYCKEKGVDLE